MQKAYSRINWENYPSTKTAVNEDNLNKMDYALDEIDGRVVNLAGYEERAKDSEENAAQSEENAKDSELNAKKYAEEAKDSAENVGNLIVPKGDVTFEELKTVDAKTGYMYKITNDFYTDQTFADGAGNFYLSGTKVYLNKDGLWELLTSTSGGASGSTTDVAIPVLKNEWVELDDGRGTFRYHADVQGLKADSNPLILLSPVNPQATEEELKAYDLLQDKTIVEDGHIILSASARPEISFTIILKSATVSEGQAIADVTNLVAKVNELETEVDELNSGMFMNEFTKQSAHTSSSEWVTFELDFTDAKFVRFIIWDGGSNIYSPTIVPLCFFTIGQINTIEYENTKAFFSKVSETSVKIKIATSNGLNAHISLCK